MLNGAVWARLQRATGIDLSAAAVSAAVKRRMKARGITDHATYERLLLSDAAELDGLIDLVVVPETWFFRDADALTATCVFVRQKRATAQPLARPLRLLSIPCASGEEPASLVMALLDAGVSANHFTVDAVDVSRQSIERTRAGLYHRNAFRTADLGFRDRYFTHTEAGYALSATIRDRINSQQGNLLTLEKPAPGSGFDVIFCRNLLIYFDEPTQVAAIQQLHALLADDGLLLVGYAEAATVSRHGFSMVPFPRAFALKKQVAQGTLPLTLASPLSSRPTSQPMPRQRSLRARATGAVATPLAPPSAGAAPRLPLWSTPGLGDQPAPEHTAAGAPGARLVQARLLADAGNTEQACVQYLAHLQTTPDCVEAHFMLGLLSEQANASVAAGTYLRRAVYLDPAHYEALCHLALLSERAGQAHEAARLRLRAARVLARRSQRTVAAHP